MEQKIERPPPPYEDINKSFELDYSLNVTIIDENIVSINIIDIRNKKEYDKFIKKNDEFWNQNKLLFQDNYDNFVKIMKLKFIDNYHYIFNHYLQLIDDKISFRMYYNNIINPFDIRFDIHESENKLVLMKRITDLEEKLNEKYDENEKIVDEFIIEEL